MAEQDAVPPRVAEALATEAAAIVKRYRVDEQQAKEAIDATMRDAAISRAVTEEVAHGRGRGTALRRLAKEARSRVYHELRRYTNDAEERERLLAQLQARVTEDDREGLRETVAALLRSHVSTRERMPSYDEFERIVAELVGTPRSIVDLGSGLHPLAQPFEDPEAAPQVYVAIDRDAPSIRILETFAGSLRGPRLLARELDLEHVDWEAELARAEVDSFDLAYLLKLVPVLARQQPSALRHVAEVPAATLVVTGSKEALTRHESIARREERVIRRFLDTLSPSEVTRRETDGEIVFVVRR